MLELKLPRLVTIEMVMFALSNGHGYLWRVLLKSPCFLVHGTPPNSELPEVLLIETGKLILDGGTSLSITRIRHLLEVLARTGGNY